MLGLVHSGFYFVFNIRPTVIIPRITRYLQAIRASPPAPLTPANLKLGTAGFCWGGRYAVMLCHDTPESRAVRGTGTLRPLLDCSFTAHPAFLSIPDDFDKAIVPLSIAGGTEDELLPEKQMAEVKKALDAKGGLHEVVVYEGAIHGFAVRGDPNDPKQADMGLQAENQAVNWFRRHFS